MNNELQQHKKSDTVKWILTLIAFVLVGVMLIGIICGWFEKSNKETEPQTAQTGGMLVGESEGSGIALMSAVVAAEAYEDYGISPLAETAYTLTATVTPSDANDKSVDWTVKWKNASSSWAQGKTVTNYVTVTPESDGALTAAVACLDAFGEQIEISVTSRDNSSAKATCTVDYAQRLKSVSFSLGNFAILSNYDSGVMPSANVKMEIGKNITGVGGAVNVSYEGNDVYTVKDTFSVRVEMTRYTYSSPEYYQPLGESVKYGAEFPIDVTNSSVYFDRSLMDQLGLYMYVSHGDLQLSQADVATLSSLYDAWSKNCDWIVYFIVSVTGEYSSKTVHCYAKYDGYINSTPVSGVALDEASLIY